MRETKTIRCEEVVDQLLTFLDGEVGAERRRQIEHHLEECRACCSRADFELALRSRVRAVATRQSPVALRKKIGQLIEKF